MKSWNKATATCKTYDECCPFMKRNGLYGRKVVRWTKAKDGTDPDDVADEIEDRNPLTSFQLCATVSKRKIKKGSGCWQDGSTNMWTGSYETPCPKGMTRITDAELGEPVGDWPADTPFSEKDFLTAFGEPKEAPPNIKMTWKPAKHFDGLWTVHSKGEEGQYGGTYVYKKEIDGTWWFLFLTLKKAATSQSYAQYAWRLEPERFYNSKKYEHYVSETDDSTDISVALRPMSWKLLGDRKKSWKATIALSPFVSALPRKVNRISKISSYDTSGTPLTCGTVQHRLCQA